MPPRPTPINLWKTAQRIQTQHDTDTAAVVLKEYIQGHYPGLGDNTALGIARDIADGDTSSFEQLGKADDALTARTGCGCDDGVNRDSENLSKREPLTRVKAGFTAKASDGMVIYGPGSVSIVDSEGDKITGPALKEALPSLLRRKNLSLEHMDIQPGEILEKWEDPDGNVYKTEVREVTKEDLEDFPRMAKVGVEPGDDALFVLAKIWDDTEFAREAQEQVLKGDLRCFSISGQAISESVEQKCDGYDCKLVNVIDKLDLSAVTLCAEPMNQAAGDFQVLSKAMKQEAQDRGWMQKKNDGFPGGFVGAVKALAAREDEDDRDLCDAVRKRAAKLKATLEGHEPADEVESELYGLLAAIVDAAEEDEHEAVSKLYKRFMEKYKMATGGVQDEVDAESGVGATDAPDDMKAEAEDDPEVREEVEDTLEAVGEDDMADVAEEADDLSDAAEAEVAKTLTDLKKKLPPDADYEVVDPPTGTPSHPDQYGDHGEIAEDSPLEQLAADYNSAHPGDSDRLDGAAGQVQTVDTGERETGENDRTEVEKALTELAKECPAPEAHTPDDPLNEDTETMPTQQEVVEGAMQKPSPEGVGEEEYDSCVEQVKEEGDAENAYAVCADALKALKKEWVEDGYSESGNLRAVNTETGERVYGDRAERALMGDPEEAYDVGQVQDPGAMHDRQMDFYDEVQSDAWDHLGDDPAAPDLAEAVAMAGYGDEEGRDIALGDVFEEGTEEYDYAKFLVDDAADGYSAGDEFYAHQRLDELQELAQGTHPVFDSKACRGHVQDTQLHKNAMASLGFNAVYDSRCPTCFDLMKTYDNAKSYFDAARHLQKTGALRLGWLSQADLPRFRKERAAGLFSREIPTVGSA